MWSVQIHRRTRVQGLTKTIDHLKGCCHRKTGVTHDNIIGTQNRQILIMLTEPSLGRTAQRLNGTLKTVGMQNSKVTIMRCL